MRPSWVVVVRVEHAAKGDGVGGGEKGVDDADVLGPLGDLDLWDFLLVVAFARRRRRRRAVLLRGGEASAKTWYGETRDIAADAARAFASPPRPATLRYIAVSADTDDTATSGRARIAGLVLSGGGDD